MRFTIDHYYWSGNRSKRQQRMLPVPPHIGFHSFAKFGDLLWQRSNIMELPNASLG
jgi:hypothetical protein